jgi:hypothetical protein
MSRDTKQAVPFDVSSNHWSIVGFTECVTREQLREWLLAHGDNILRCGKLCELKKKSLGAGVYKIWFEERKP